MRPAVILAGALVLAALAPHALASNYLKSSASRARALGGLADLGGLCGHSNEHVS